MGKNAHPVRVVELSSHQAQALRRLLLGILDGDIGQDVLTEAMALKLYDAVAGAIGLAPYNKKERDKAGFRRFATGSLPEVREVLEVHSVLDPSAYHHRGSFSLIAPDPNAGRKNVYSTLRIDYETGQTRVTGRELPLEDARAVAMRPAHLDGRPLHEEPDRSSDDLLEI